MKSKAFFGSLMGSVAIYVAMAACVATETPQAFTGAGGASGTGSSSASGGFGGFVDAMVDPVPDANAEPPSSGSRLKAKRYIAADGARSDVFGWHDSVRKEDCAFRYASDAITRCLPAVAYQLPFYADDQCGQQIASLSYGKSPCDGAFKYALKYEQDLPQCSNTGPDVHEFGSPIVPTWVYYKKTDGSCVTYSGLETLTDWHTIGAKIPPTEFVAATLTVDP